MLLAASAVLALLWLVQLALAVRIVRSIPTVTSLPLHPFASWPKMSIIVPARNEEDAIANALASKLECGYPNLEIVAIDDRSTDRTGALIDEAAAANPQIIAAHIKELPDGWLGKLNAMAKGLERANGEWILFSDADVHVEPGVLERLVGHAEAEQIDFIAVFPRMNPVSLLIDGVLAILFRMLLITSRAWRANDDRSQLGLGVGAFNLARRSVLQRTHAVQTLRMEVADDVGLGVLLKHAGARTRLYAGRREVHLTWLASLGAVVKSSYKGGHLYGFSFWKPLVVGALPALIELGIPIAAIASGGLSAVLGIACLVLPVAVAAIFLRHFDGPKAGIISWPLGQVLTSALMIGSGLSAWRHQGIYWRGTFYSRAALEAGRAIEVGSLKPVHR